MKTKFFNFKREYIPIYIAIFLSTILLFIKFNTYIEFTYLKQYFDHINYMLLLFNIIGPTLIAAFGIFIWKNMLYYRAIPILILIDTIMVSLYIFFDKQSYIITPIMVSLSYISLIYITFILFLDMDILDE